tara:strand:- start:4842 stop:5291 length:450 start_codon:yes stop_codon:yes gene_type:complete
MSNEINDYFGYSFEQVKGESLDLYGCVLTAPGLTAEDLHKTYEKRITLLCNGRYYGFAGIVSAITFVLKKEKQNKITDITWWGDSEALNFKKLLFALTGADVDDILWSKKDNEVWKTRLAKKQYLSRSSGVTLSRSINKYKIICKPLIY